MRLNQITAAASDLAQSIAFYEMLGLRLIVRADHYARFELPAGEATFSLHVADGPIPRENAPQIYFEVLDVGFEVRRLKHAGVEIEKDVAAQTWLWTEAWLRDPAGNAICLFNAGENRRYPPWRLDSAPGDKNLHLIIRDGARWSLVRAEPHQLAALAEKHADYKTSLGPFDLYALLAMLEAEWPQLFLEQQDKIRAFALSDDTEIEI